MKSYNLERTKLVLSFLMFKAMRILVLKFSKLRKPKAFRLMTAVYREQWIFWAATNVFSIYLWWGKSLQIQEKYLIYLINSLVGWYQWTKAAKKGY